MTGEEVTVLVPATATITHVIDVAVFVTDATVDKRHALVHNGEPLLPSSKFAKHNVVEG